MSAEYLAVFEKKFVEPWNRLIALFVGLVLGVVLMLFVFWLRSSPASALTPEQKKGLEVMNRLATMPPPKMNITTVEKVVAKDADGGMVTVSKEDFYKNYAGKYGNKTKLRGDQ